MTKITICVHAFMLYNFDDKDISLCSGKITVTTI